MAKKNVTNAPLIFVSPDQVTFQVPSSVAAGIAKVTVTAPGSSQTARNVGSPRSRPLCLR